MMNKFMLELLTISSYVGNSMYFIELQFARLSFFMAGSMNATPENIRFLVESCRRNNLPPSQAHAFVTHAWGSECISIATVYRLYSEYESGERTSFHDAPRSGRPHDVRIKENVEMVKHLVDTNPHITVDELMVETNLSHGTVYRILTEDLQLRSVVARWIPHHLSLLQKQNRVTMAENILHFLQQHRRGIQEQLVVTDEKWFYHRSMGTKSSNRAWSSKDTPQPRVVKRNQFEPKTMAIVAFSFDGKFQIDIIPSDETVTGAYYHQFLKKIIHNYQRHVNALTADKMVLMHDNARPHMQSDVTEYLQKKQVTLLPQPPWSPDFNMLDRWVFTFLERNRNGYNFADANDLKSYLTDELKAMSPNDLSYQFKKWQDDLRLIINSGGDYL